MSLQVSKYRYWAFCLYSGYVFMAALLVFWVIVAGAIPLMPPTVTADEVARYFIDNKNAVRAGMVGVLTFMPFYLFFGLGVAKLMEVVDRSDGILPLFQRWAAGLNTVIFTITWSLPLLAAYRPEEMDPRLLQFLYDSFCIMLLVPFYAGALAQITFGMAVLGDSENRLRIPRWLGWFSIWLGFMAVVENILPFARSGMFARNGAFNFWFEANLFFIWMNMVAVYSLKALGRLRDEALSTARAGGANV